MRSAKIVAIMFNRLRKNGAASPRIWTTTCIVCGFVFFSPASRPLLAFQGGSVADSQSSSKTGMKIDASTLRGKVLCGYQGWFRCDGDSAKQGWKHWSRDPRRITPESLTFEMWPDMSEYEASEKYPAPGFKDNDGKQATLFSSVNPKTVDRHFDWMRQYGIDGVFLQRFLVELGDPSLDQVLANVRKAAEKSGRVYALSYDLSGAPRDKIFDLLTTDWKRLVDKEKITKDPRYLYHDGKPVLVVWGFYSDRFDAKLAGRIIDFFKNDPKYQVKLVGGCEWWWRSEKDRKWAKVFRRFDVISPWNVGNHSVENNQKQASTSYWKEDFEEAKRAGMGYLPVFYPGFGWNNLKGRDGAKDAIPRLGGEFFRRQFTTAAKLGIDMAQVAMFDEVDEGTAVFKVCNAPPRPGRFLTFEGLATDHYLRLTGEGTKMIHDARKRVQKISAER